MTKTAAWDAVTTTYEDVAPRLDEVISHFSRRHGAAWRVVRPHHEPEEYAGELFLKAYTGYKGGRDSFHTRLSNRVAFDLTDMLRRGLHRRKLLRRDHGAELDDAPAPAPPAFDLNEFIAALPADAAEVVKLAVVETPRALAKLVEGKQRFGSAASFRESLREYLLTRGWTRERVRVTFAEIREALR